MTGNSIFRTVVIRKMKSFYARSLVDFCIEKVCAVGGCLMYIDMGGWLQFFFSKIQMNTEISGKILNEKKLAKLFSGKKKNTCYNKALLIMTWIRKLVNRLRLSSNCFWGEGVHSKISLKTPASKRASRRYFPSTGTFTL